MRFELVIIEWRKQKSTCNRKIGTVKSFYLDLNLFLFYVKNIFGTVSSPPIGDPELP